MTNHMHGASWGLFGVLAAALLPGCIFVAEDDSPRVGSLTVEWSIDGRRDPFDCVDLGADRLEILLYLPRGALIDEFDPPCEAFGVSVDLVEGRYYGDATLIDRLDRSATVTEPIDAIDVVADTELVVSVDFPLGSFL